MYKLIIVDDETIIRNGLSRIIKWNELGFELVAAVGSATEALSQLEKTPVDAILTDISMPEMSGLELICFAKEKYPWIRAVIISGYNEFDYAMEAIKLKAEAYILKPIDPDRICAVFAELKRNFDVESARNSETMALQSEYELMQILHNDTDSMRTIQRNYQEKVGHYRVSLLQTCARSEGTTIVRELEKCLSRLFYRRVHGLYAVVLFSSQIDHFKTALSTLSQDDTSFTFRMSISMEFENLYDVTSAYLNALNILKYNPRDKIVSYDDLKQTDISGEKEITYQTFINLIEQDQEVESTICSLFHQLRKRHPQNSCDVCSRILHNIALYFQIKDVPAFRISELCTRQDENILSLSEIEVCFRNDFSMLVKKLKVNSESMAVMVGNQAKHLVDENYADKMLSLGSVAKTLHVSYGYLSTVFTKVVGENFKTYLMSVRMEKARSILMQRKYKIYEITDMVGYTSPRYFNDVFKKSYGISPMDYLMRLSHHSLTEKDDPS